MSEITSIIEKLKEFRDQREWSQFHNPKDLAIALNIESSELLECFLWKNSEDGDINKIREELADVFSYAFLILDKYDFDLSEIVSDKIAKNKLKYPIEKAKGSAKKYDEL
jgi:NTP pyrophosphatase (non-canonical NTP hydrolase)